MNPSIIISAIVCTYSRAHGLADAVDSLAHQDLDKSRYEIIIVDNASKDETQSAIQRLQERHSEHNIVSVFEKEPGLGHARNTGFRHAQGRYVAYMDDDARASGNWLSHAADCFERLCPSPVAIGGQCHPFYPTPKPNWFKDEYEIRTWGDEPRILRPGESFSGSNMIFRREILDQCGGFDTNVGVKGRYLMLGEETALFDRIWKHSDGKAILYYSPDLFIYHEVPAFKMRVPYHLRRGFAGGQSWYLMYGPKNTVGRLKLLPFICRDMIAETTRALGNRKRHPMRENWYVEEVAPLLGHLGRLAAATGLHIRIRQG